MKFHKFYQLFIVQDKQYGCFIVMKIRKNNLLVKFRDVFQTVWKRL